MLAGVPVPDEGRRAADAVQLRHVLRGGRGELHGVSRGKGVPGAGRLGDIRLRARYLRAGGSGTVHVSTGISVPGRHQPRIDGVVPQRDVLDGFKGQVRRLREGFLQPVEWIDDANACVACEKGYYSNFTAAVGKTTCSPCPADTYCPLAVTTCPPRASRTEHVRQAGKNVRGRLHDAAAAAAADEPPPCCPRARRRRRCRRHGGGWTYPRSPSRVDGTVATFNSTLFKIGIATPWERRHRG